LNKREVALEAAALARRERIVAISGGWRKTFCKKSFSIPQKTLADSSFSEDNDAVLVQYLADVLYQIQERGLASGVSKLDFTDPNHISFYYTDKYTVELGDAGKVEYKFGMLLSALGQLKLGDVGVIDLSSGSSVHFRPN